MIEATGQINDIFEKVERGKNDFIIYANNLRKVYNSKVVALHNLNIGIESGDIFGLIGPNGAGKTTFLTILATLLKPSYGEAWIDGLEVTRDRQEVHRIIGYMSDFFALYEDMKVWEYLDFFAHLYEVPINKRKQRIDFLLEILNLTDKKYEYTKGLSRGMRQRVCLGRAIIHDPKVLLLDEPASGLDPRARIEFREVLRDLGKLGKTIIISSHILTELSDFCNSIGIIERGKMIECGKVNAVMNKFKGHNTLIIEVLDKHEEVAEILESQENIASIEVKDNKFVVMFTGELDEICQLNKELVTQDIPVVSFNRKEENLEDIFMKISSGEVS